MPPQEKDAVSPKDRQLAASITRGLFAGDAEFPVKKGEYVIWSQRQRKSRILDVVRKWIRSEGTKTMAFVKIKYL